ncbi:glyco3, capsid size determination Sid domain protein [Salmonella enterica subsp. enterica]|nr:glyco3, capsid size determination Sid domain protein [Salmonella enterica subsp. enterica]
MARQNLLRLKRRGEPVLFKTGLSASTLPHMEHDVAATPVQRKVWQEKMREREANLKARGLLS